MRGALLGVAIAAAVVGLAAVVDRHGAGAPPAPAWLESAVDLIGRQEGYRRHIYADTAGNPTIGYGTNLAAGFDRETSDWLLRKDLRDNLAALREGWPAFDRQPDDVRIALASMAYELGGAGVLGFGDMLAALERGDRGAAAAAALASKWHAEVPGRAAEVAAIIRGE